MKRPRPNLTGPIISGICFAAHAALGRVCQTKPRRKGLSRAYTLARGALRPKGLRSS
jgi:hypothetical protein